MGIAGNSVVHIIDTVLLPFVPAAGPDGEAPEPAPESNCTTIAELATSLPLTLSILVEAVIAADLLGFVADPSTAATVFAPPNDAFVALLEALQLDGQRDSDRYPHPGAHLPRERRRRAEHGPHGRHGDSDAGGPEPHRG